MITAMYIASGLANSALILLALLAGQWLLARYLPPGRIVRPVLSGLLLGFTAIAVMTFPVTLQPGVFFDARTAVLPIGALFGGPQVGLVAGAVAAAYRIWLGGDGASVGVATILLSVLAGLAWRHWRASAGAERLRPWDFAALGFGVNLVCIGLFLLLPLPFEPGEMPLLLPIFLAVMTLTTLAIGLLYREIDKTHRFESILAASEDRFEQLFHHAAVPIWEIDAARLWRRLQRLRAAGVSDLRGHLLAHDRDLQRLVAGGIVRKVNQASLDLFRADDEAEAIGRIDRFWTEESRRTFIDAVCATWNGETRFSAETVMQARDGTLLAVVLSFPVPQDEEDARQVPLCIADITRRRLAERKMADERRRLQEILWGTNVGTWEWNVQTGETRFDERWAEIVGYTLEELGPVDIHTWIELCHPDDLAQSDARLKRVFAGQDDYYECEARMRHKDGSWVWVLDRGKVVEWDSEGRPLRMSGTHADVTARKAAEARLQRVDGMRHAILRCQGALLRAEDETKILQETCEILVEARAYSLAWIGLPEAGGVGVVPQARAGVDAAYVDQLAGNAGGNDGAFGTGPAGTALRTGKVQLVNDLTRAPDYAPWAGIARDHGLNAVVAAPVHSKTGVAAVLCVYSKAEEGFDEEEVSLLAEFAGNLALVLDGARAAQENRKISAALARSALSAVDVMARTIEKRDPYTSGHQERVADLAVAIARRLGWDGDRIEGLRLGAMIHDIGKIYVPAEILNRPGRLSDSEMEIIRAHAQIGGEILEGTEFPWPIREMVEQHHERLDGSGYPHGLRGSAIVPEARVLAVADVVEAMSSHRPYRPGRGLDEAMAEIRRGRGTIYDAAAVDACIAILRAGGFPAHTIAA